jgi:uncharacterized protein (DUF4415 family)
MKDKNIVRYSRNTLPKGKTQWEKLESMSEEEIESSAKADTENPRWTKNMLNSAKLQMPKKKISVHMYLDQDIVEWFKSKGKGYQPRINSVLKSYVHKHLHKPS